MSTVLHHCCSDSRVSLCYEVLLLFSGLLNSIPQRGDRAISARKLLLPAQAALPLRQWCSNSCHVAQESPQKFVGRGAMATLIVCPQMSGHTGSPPHQMTWQSMLDHTDQASILDSSVARSSVQGGAGAPDHTCGQTPSGIQSAARPWGQIG